MADNYGPASAYITGVQAGQQSRLNDYLLGQRQQQDLLGNQITQEQLARMREKGATERAQQKALNESNILSGILSLPPDQQEAAFLQVANQFDPNTLKLFSDSTGQVRFDPRRAEMVQRMAGTFAQIEPTQLEKQLQFAYPGDTAKQREIAGGILQKKAAPSSALVNVNTGESSFKVPAGFMLKDPNDPSKGVKPIPGGPQDKVTGETAGKAQMLRTAQKQLDLVQRLTFKDNGEPDWVNIANSRAATPKTEGRKLASAMEVGIQAITRLETGAAMPPAEVNNTRKRFQPSVFDSEDVVKLKLQMYSDFVNGALKLLDPSGRFNEARFNEELQNRIDASQADTNIIIRNHPKFGDVTNDDIEATMQAKGWNREKTLRWIQNAR